MEGQKLPVYECKVGGMDNTGIFAISFVDLPAIEHNFVALKKRQAAKVILDRQKQILTGPVLIPDQLIYRNDDVQGEYYLKFTAADIEKVALKMMKTGIALRSTTHQHEKPLKGNYLAELWTVGDSKLDKSVALGLGELPVGTLVASYKIESPLYWRTEVLTGRVKGFSLEGLFNFNNVNMKKTVKKAVPQNTAKLSAFSKMMLGLGIPVFAAEDTAAAADDLATVAVDDEVDAGEPFLIFELADGTEAMVDSDGYATIDGEQMPAGEHQLADGNFIVIDDSGMLVITQEEGSGEEPAAADVAAKKVADAKLRAQKYLKAQDPQKAKLSKDAAELKRLKARIAVLEKEPSTGKATPTVEGTGKDPKDMSHNERMAAVLKSRLDRKKGK